MHGKAVLVAVALPPHSIDRRAGIREIGASRYATFEFEGRRPFATIDASESAPLMEREL